MYLTFFRFFKSEIEGNNGIQFLASLVKHNVSDPTGKLVTKEESSNIMKLGYLYNNLKPKERTIFLDVLQYVKNDKNPLVPENESRARQIFLRGKNSLNENLPLMKIVPLDDHHAYIPLDEVICHFLLHGEKLECFELVKSGICKTKNFKRIMENCPNDSLAIGILDWSDDAQSSKSVKVKGSTWIKTVSFLPLTDNSTN